jgi:ribose transport system ATP-binding protein
VNRLADDGLAVLMGSSELEELIEGSDRVVVMRDGSTVTELGGEEITEDAIMDAMATGGATAAPEGAPRG